MPDGDLSDAANPNLVLYFVLGAVRPAENELYCVTLVRSGVTPAATLGRALQRVEAESAPDIVK